MIAPKLALRSESLATICRRYHVRELSLFGSSVRDDFGPDSDVDILVDFLPGSAVGYITLFKLQDELSDLMQRPVDLVSKRGPKPLLRDEILATAEVVYET